MRFELDHLFILTEPAGTEATLLQSYGLVEGEPNHHPGQGTANRRFFFSNSMLELLWVCDKSEALSPPADRLRLVDRSQWRENGASPFGICLRPVEPGSMEKPFPGWLYRPPYLSDALTIHVGDNSDRITEPLVFYLNFARCESDHSQPSHLSHIEGVRVSGLPRNRSAIFDAVTQVPALEASAGEEPLLEVRFGGGGPTRDFRPDLPLVLC
jgi:hypothetical protein